MIGVPHTYVSPGSSSQGRGEWPKNKCHLIYEQPRSLPFTPTEMHAELSEKKKI